MIDFEKKTTPAAACEFADLCTVEFAAGDDGNKNSFSITGYSGEIIKNHWWWGNVAFDLSGMKFKSKKTPVLDSHTTGRRIGFAEKQVIEDKVRFEGPFLSNQIAKELQSDMQEGFPMQASLSLEPSIIEEVKDGASVSVNGYTLKGPGSVFRKSVIKEVSMCVFGYDSNTESKAFADGGRQLAFELTNTKENDMSKEETKTKVLTATEFAAENPAVFEEITSKAKTEGKAEGAKQTKEEFAKFAEKFGDDPAFCIEQLKAGVSLADAVEAENAKLKKQNKEFAEKSKDTKTDDSLASNEFSDTASGGDGGEEASDEDGWKAEFAGSKDLKTEFGEVGNYVAFKIEEAKGNINLKNNNRRAS